jgi:hypothetical protein
MVGRVLPLSASLALLLAAAPLQAQLTEVQEQHRFEIIPVAGYVWGGSYETDASSAFPAGHLRISPSFAWGGIISFLAHGGSAVELTYLRQDSDIKFDPVAGGGETPLGDFAMNYIQIGGRQEFGVGGTSGIRPFIGASLGINILDPGNPNISSDTRFSWSIGGGLVKMLNNGRVGLRSDIKLWITPVPSGDYGTWCDFYGCFVAEGTAWVTQGQWSGGLVFAF